MVSQISTLGALVGLILAIILIIKKGLFDKSCW